MNRSLEIKEIPGSGSAQEPGLLCWQAERKVGVIGTSATVRTESYARAIQNIDPGIKVYCKACPLFVPLVEEGLTDTDITRLTAQYYLYEMIDLGVDCLILGCTHYPLLMETIQGTVGKNSTDRQCTVDIKRGAGYPERSTHSQMKIQRTGFQKFIVTDMAQFRNCASAFLGNQLPEIEKITTRI